MDEKACIYDSGIFVLYEQVAKRIANILDSLCLQQEAM